MISSAIVSEIGGLLTFAEIILTAVIGIFLLQNFRVALAHNLTAFYNGQISHDDFLKLNISMAFGAILLIVPGFFTDIVGVLLQFQFVAVIIANMFTKKDMDIRHNQYFKDNSFKRQKEQEDVIDVEILDKDSNTADDKHTISK